MTQTPSKLSLSLDGTWQITGRPPDNGSEIRVSGPVPGHVHPALEAAGKIPDPFWRDQADQCQWVEKWHWTYSRTFDAPSGFNPAWTELEFAGLDTYAEIVLNGQALGRTANMFIPHRFEVGALLRPAGNELTMRFTPYQEMIAGKDTKLWAAFFTGDRLHVRRMQCTFHWDWVNRFVSFGVWRPVSLFSYTSACIRDLFVHTRAIGSSSAALNLEIEVERRAADGIKANVTITGPDGRDVWSNTVKVEEGTLRIAADLASPQLWWPHGYGEQPLYRCRAVLTGADGAVLDTRETAFGIRTARIEQLVDQPGSDEERRTRVLRQAKWPSGEERNGDTPGRGFTLVVNGERIFCKGGNWVPADPFPSRITPAHYDRLIRLAREGNINLLRCWGGGIYEPDAFWDACNRQGVMISQDFMMACGGYPAGDPEFMDNLRQEVPAAIKMLRNHPSLAWWSGDNENGMFSDEDETQAPYAVIANQVTGPACRALDPSRTFLPTSPFGGRSNMCLTIGDTHFSALPFERREFVSPGELAGYRERIKLAGRFLSESACVGSPPMRSLLKFMTAEDIADPSGRMWNFHTKDNPHKPADMTLTLYGMLERVAGQILGPARTIDEKVRKMEYIQYEWVRLAVEAMRRAKWYCGGIQFWMYNDCWPASGWSLVDYYGLPKAGWYAMKRTARPVIASIEDVVGGFRVWVCNDSLKPVKGKLTVSVRSWRGRARWRKAAPIAVGANANAVVCEIRADEAAGLDKDSVLVAEIAHDGGADRAMFYLGMPCEMAPLPVRLKVAQEGTGAEGRIVISANGYARVVSLDADLDFSDNYFDLLPGERKTVAWRSPDGKPAGAIPVTCWNAQAAGKAKQIATN